MDVVEEHDRMVERVAAIDVATGELRVCVRIPGEAGRRRQAVRTYQATTCGILLMITGDLRVADDYLDARPEKMRRCRFSLHKVCVDAGPEVVHPGLKYSR